MFRQPSLGCMRVCDCNRRAFRVKQQRKRCSIVRASELSEIAFPGRSCGFDPASASASGASSGAIWPRRGGGGGGGGCGCGDSGGASSALSITPTP